MQGNSLYQAHGIQDEWLLFRIAIGERLEMAVVGEKRTLGVTKMFKKLSCQKNARNSGRILPVLKLY